MAVNQSQPHENFYMQCKEILHEKVKIINLRRSTMSFFLCVRLKCVNPVTYILLEHFIKTLNTILLPLYIS